MAWAAGPVSRYGTRGIGQAHRARDEADVRPWLGLCLGVNEQQHVGILMRKLFDGSRKGSVGELAGGRREQDAGAAWLDLARAMTQGAASARGERLQLDRIGVANRDQQGRSPTMPRHARGQRVRQERWRVVVQKRGHVPVLCPQRVLI